MSYKSRVKVQPSRRVPDIRCRITIISVQLVGNIPDVYTVSSILFCPLASWMVRNNALFYDRDWDQGPWNQIAFLSARYCCAPRNILSYHLLDVLKYSRKPMRRPIQASVRSWPCRIIIVAELSNQCITDGGWPVETVNNPEPEEEESPSLETVLAKSNSIETIHKARRYFRGKRL